MPQFDFANVFVHQFFWFSILFAILYFGVVRFTLPKLGKVMGEREDKVTGDLANAEKAKGDADAMGETYRKDITDAQEQARADLATAKAKSATAVEKKLAAANKRVEASLAKAQDELNAARDGAMAEIEAVAADNASAIVQHLTGAKTTTAAAKKAAKAALAN